MTGHDWWYFFAGVGWGLILPDVGRWVRARLQPQWKCPQCSFRASSPSADVIDKVAAIHAEQHRRETRPQ